MGIGNIPLQFSLLGGHHLRQGLMSSSHWEKFHCNTSKICSSQSTLYSKPQAGVLNQSKNKKGKRREPYTKAPPALPNLVTLPFPNELFMSFIAASSAFWRSRKRGSESAERAPLTLTWSSQRTLFTAILKLKRCGREQDWNNRGQGKHWDCECEWVVDI